MATRDILDSLGNIIGSLTLPDEATEDQWQQALTPYAAPVTENVIPLLRAKTFNATSTVTTSSGTPVTVEGMSSKPEKGEYVVFFSGSINTGGASAQGEFGIYVNDTLVAETKRSISCNLQLLGGLVSISLNTIAVGTYTGGQVSLSGDQTIDIKFRSTNGGTIGFNERTMTLIKVTQ